MQRIIYNNDAYILIPSSYLLSYSTIKKNYIRLYPVIYIYVYSEGGVCMYSLM